MCICAFYCELSINIATRTYELMHPTVLVSGSATSYVYCKYEYLCYKV